MLSRKEGRRWHFMNVIAQSANMQRVRKAVAGAAVHGQRTWRAAWRFAGALVTAAMVFAASAEAGPVDGRLRVCVISLNEPDEVEAFRVHLDPDRFAIVDVRAVAVTRGGERGDVTPRSWLLDACTPELTCDLLVISGEFAGHFFGQGPVSLGLQDLEEASCQDRCAGLFRHPQEVYLLACNTLAT